MKLYRTRAGATVEQTGRFFEVGEASWDGLLAREDLLAHLEARRSGFKEVSGPGELLSPAAGQEVWAAGVTYLRSREARREEAEAAGGGDFYDRVYAAARPELFFKSMGYRSVGSGAKVRIRRDSKWNVPEPELTLVVAATGKIIGYTVGNDMSSRDIEGENPLYLPQAKVYDGACALGPCIWLTRDPLPTTTAITLQILRAGKEVFGGKTDVSRIKRPLPSLAEYLYRELSFPHGSFLMTGTGIVPDSTFTLQPGDEISIAIDNIGTLINAVA